MEQKDLLIPIQFDNVSYNKKPENKDISGIKSRTQKSDVKFLSTKEIGNIIEKGKSFSPGILQNGLKASDWVMQQLFFIDIDNANLDQPILTPQKAIKICKDNGLPPAIFYPTFSNSKDIPKFRLGFALDKPIKNNCQRKLVVTTLISLFSQADKSCVNPDRIFFATNKEVKSSNKTISLEKILEFSNKQQISTKQETELKNLIANFNFKEFLKKEGLEILSESESQIKYRTCPICGHNDDFVFYPQTNSFYCFGAHGNVGGSIIDYLVYTKKINKKQAIQYFKRELCNINESNNAILNTFSSYDLLKSNLPPVYWIVENFIPQGLTVIASPPKNGKSWFVLQLGICVATGQDFLEYNTNRSDVLYLALEDSKNRLKERLMKLLETNEAPKNLTIATKADSVSKNLINMLEDYIENNPSTKLIIIDTFQKVRTSTKRDNLYANDYSETGLLKELADKYGIGIIIVHHVRKAKDDYVFNTVSGTNGIIGAADTIFVFEKDKKDTTFCKLHVTGRDVSQDEICLVFEDCKWVSNGKFDSYLEANQLKEYYEDTMLASLKTLLKMNNNSWQGTATELLTSLKIYCNIDYTPEKLAKRLKKLKNLLFSQDSITYMPPPENGSNGKRIHKFRVDDYLQSLVD